jgi:peptidoglycan/LPS O-acetylase OafA/YrhL
MTVANEAKSTTADPVFPKSLPVKEQRIPYIDGLRAYSILCVMFAHTRGDGWNPVAWSVGAPLLADGQLGVRIFFVISGFLITTLLLNEYDRKGKISIRAFYERRVARIFPAFYLYIGVILVCTLVGIMSVPLTVFIASSTFTWNFIHFYRHVIVPDDSVVLTHFWTLSIEEQFYLVWPSCLVFLGLRRSMRVAIAGAIALPLLRLFTFLNLHTGTLRNAIESRFVQDLILMGVLAAFAVRAGALERLRQNRFRAAVPWISAAILFLLNPWLSSMGELPFSGCLVPSLQGIATVLLIFWLLSGKGGILRSFLESWPMVQLGLLSYSLYIWHVLFTLWHGMRWIRFPWNLLAPLPVAVLCYWCWELPMRKRIRAWFHQAERVHGQ